MNVLIIGYSKCGKSLAGDLIARWPGGLVSISISTSDILFEQYASHANISNAELRENKDKYRHQLWEFGRKLQADDPLCLVRQALAMAFCGDDAVNVVTGVRNRDEMVAIRAAKMFDLIIWINRNGCEPNSTDCLKPSDADIVIDNNGTIEELQRALQLAISSRIL